MAGGTLGAEVSFAVTPAKAEVPPKPTTIANINKTPKPNFFLIASLL
jgi:hypothetical protein